MKVSTTSSKRIATLYAVAAVLAGILTVVGWLGGSFWFFDLFNHFQIQYAIFLAATAVLLLCRKTWRLAALAGLFLIVPLARLLPLMVPAGAKPAGGSLLRVATFNVLTSNQRYEDVVAWVREADPDVIFFPEANERWAEALRPLHASHPHVIEHFAGGNFGFVLYSKLPILEQEIVPCADLELPYLRMKLQKASGDFTFLGAHPIPPIGAARSLDRDVYLKAIASAVAAENGPVVVAGDLNATPWSHAVRPLFAAGLRGWRASPTWQLGNPLIAIPIDHVIYRGPRDQMEGLELQKCWVGPDLGSDHRPVVAELSW